MIRNSKDRLTERSLKKIRDKKNYMLPAESPKRKPINRLEFQSPLYLLKENQINPVLKNVNKKKNKTIKMILENQDPMVDVNGQLN